jgi:hypothetical protein
MLLRACASLDRFTLNGVEFREAAPVGRFHEVLGLPSRIIDPAPPAPVGHRNNQIHMYDALGVYLNEHHYTYTIGEVTFVLWPEESPFEPACPCGPGVEIGGITIYPGISERELLCSSIRFTQQLAGTWSAAADDLWIGFDAKGRKGRTGRRGKKRYVATLSVCLRDDPWDTRYRPA